MAALLQDLLTPQLLQDIRQVWFGHLEDEQHFVIPEISEVTAWFTEGSELDKICVSVNTIYLRIG
jgi:hypothetical protein